MDPKVPKGLWNPAIKIYPQGNIVLGISLVFFFHAEKLPKNAPNFFKDLKWTAHWRSLFVDGKGGGMVLAERAQLFKRHKMNSPLKILNCWWQGWGDGASRKGPPFSKTSNEQPIEDPYLLMARVGGLSRTDILIYLFLNRAHDWPYVWMKLCVVGASRHGQLISFFFKTEPMTTLRVKQIEPRWLVSMGGDAHRNFLLTWNTQKIWIDVILRMFRQRRGAVSKYSPLNL